MAYPFGYYKYRVRYNRYTQGPFRYHRRNLISKKFVRTTVPTRRRTFVYRKRYLGKGRRYRG